MITILTAYDNNFKDIAELNIPIIKQYCKLHNYIFAHKSIINFDKHPAWFKPIAICDELKNNSNYILWLDIDTLILKQDFILEDICKSDKQIYISKDINGINSGVMLIKNSEYMRKFFEEVSNLYSSFKDHIWWEQAAIIHLIKNNYIDIENNIEYIPQKIFNAYDKNLVNTNDDGYVCNDSFILHLPSINNKKRHETIKQYIEKYYKS